MLRRSNFFCCKLLVMDLMVFHYTHTFTYIYIYIIYGMGTMTTNKNTLRFWTKNYYQISFLPPVELAQVGQFWYFHMNIICQKPTYKTIFKMKSYLFKQFKQALSSLTQKFPSRFPRKPNKKLLPLCQFANKAPIFNPEPDVNRNEITETEN